MPYYNNPELVLKTEVDSTRLTTYELNPEGENIRKISLEETHTVFTAVKEEIGNQIDVSQKLILTETPKASFSLSITSLEDVINAVSKREGASFTQESLMTEREDLQHDGATTFTNVVNEYRESLKSSLLGTLTAAKVLPRILAVGRRAKKEDIVKALGSKKNAGIL